MYYLDENGNKKPVENYSNTVENFDSYQDQDKPNKKESGSSQAKYIAVMVGFLLIGIIAAFFLCKYYMKCDDRVVNSSPSTKRQMDEGVFGFKKRQFGFKFY